MIMTDCFHLEIKHAIKRYNFGGLAMVVLGRQLDDTWNELQPK